MRLKMLFVSLFIALTIVLNAADVKYVFVFVGDGYGENQRIITEAFTGKKLEMNSLPVVSRMGTNNAIGKTTDSAASGTALACGVKTGNGMIGVTPDGKPVESISKALKKSGFKIAIISSSPLTDATPAAHYANQKSRSMGDQIGEEMAKSGFDFFGGGVVGGKNTLTLLADNGYDVLTGTDSLAKVKKNQKTYVNSQPYTRWNFAEKEEEGLTLADYAAKAIELLKDNPQGFFIMLENGHTDYAGHSNDSGKLVREVLALDEAVKVALDFQAKHPDETLVVVTADHETGGLEIKKLNVEKLGILNDQTLSLIDANKQIRDMINKKEKPDVIFEALEKAVGIKFTPEERAKIEPAVVALATEERKSVYGGNVAFVLDAYKMRDQRLGFEYTTGGHTSKKVVTYVKGPGQELFAGPLENTDIPRIIRQIVIPGTDKEYEAKRKEIVALQALLTPYIKQGKPTDALVLNPIPYETRTVRLGDKAMKLDLPNFKSFIISDFMKGDKFYLAEISNMSEKQPLLASIKFTGKAADTYLAYDPKAKTQYVQKDGTKTWNAASLENDFRILVGPKQTVFLLLSEKPLPQFETNGTVSVGEITKSYQSSEKTQTPSFKIKTLKAPPADGDWENMEPVSFCSANGKSSEKAIVMKAATDAGHKTLFLYFQIPDDRIVAKCPADGKRDLEVYDDDCIELFFGAEKQSGYYHIAVNANGAVYDSKDGDKNWNGNFNITSQSDKNGWTMKAAIPLDNFQFTSFPLWNACYMDKPSKNIMNLSPTEGHFHDRKKFIPLEVGD